VLFRSLPLIGINTFGNKIYDDEDTRWVKMRKTWWEMAGNFLPGFPTSQTKKILANSRKSPEERRAAWEYLVIAPTFGTMTHKSMSTREREERLEVLGKWGEMEKDWYGLAYSKSRLSEGAFAKKEADILARRDLLQERFDNLNK